MATADVIMLDDMQRAASMMGRKGGKARKEALTAKRRCEIARKAAKARWAKRGKK